jgi:glycosyltransferase involved in cell wall biosynthesis
MPQPLVTIGISTYNRADGYLKDALESALAQDYPNLEILVSDNGSTDHTEAYVRGFGDPRIRYCKQAQNIGANGNFNFLLDEARGEYFLLLHDDDVLDPDLVSSCVTAKGAGSPGVIRTGTRVIGAEGHVLAENPNRAGGLSPTELFLLWFDKKTAFYFCSTLFHTAALRAAGGLRTKTNVFEDVVAIARLAARQGHANVAACKASFRLHGANKGSSLDGVQVWAADSRFLLEVLAAEMPGDAERLLKAGEPYLCARLYRYAAKLPTRGEQLRAYARIYREFGYSYSPLRFLARRGVSSLKDALRPLVKGRAA